MKTPRTDAKIDDSPYYQSRFVMVEADFAKQLETDLNRAIELLKRYRQISPQPADLYLDNNEFLAALP